MGFFTSLAKIITPLAQIAAPLIGTALTGGIPGAVAAGAAAAAAPAATPKQIAAAVTAAQAGVIAPVVAGRAIVPTVAGIVAVPGMRNVVTTTVRTTDPAGNTVGIEVLEGRPFLMRKDFVTAKRVIKALRKAAARIPKQTVPETPAKKLTKAVMARALENVTCPPKGAPPC